MRVLKTVLEVRLVRLVLEVIQELQVLRENLDKTELQVCEDKMVYQDSKVSLVCLESQVQMDLTVLREKLVLRESLEHQVG